MNREPAAHGITFRAAVRVWARIGLNSFGGPAGQIAVMHRVLVEEKRWISERRFLHALNYCMLLPGPEAQQLATYVGWLLHRTAGGLAAGILFVLPGALAMLALSFLYAELRDLRFVAGLFFGLKAAVLAIVVEAVLRIGRRALRTRAAWLLAAASFVAIFFLDFPFPLIVLGAGVIGLASERWSPGTMTRAAAAEAGGETRTVALPDDVAPAHTRPSPRRAARIVVVGLAVWFAPVAALWLTLGRDHVLVGQALFFSRAAVVTFGGAYAVLAYVAQRAVDTYGWLAPGEMVDGLGLAETTPGPLIMVLQFVGFLGAWRQAMPFSAPVAGTLGALITTWVTFVPCFLWIFLGAPWIERLREHRALNAALSAITAAVVGVVLNLAVWFALHTLFTTIAEHRIGPLRLLVPDGATLDPAALTLALAAAVATFRFHAPMLATLAGSAAAGALWHFAR